MLINIRLNEGNDCAANKSVISSLRWLILTLPLKCSLTLSAATHRFPPDLTWGSVQWTCSWWMPWVSICVQGQRLHGGGTVGSGRLTMPGSQGTMLNKNRFKSTPSKRHARQYALHGLFGYARKDSADWDSADFNGGVYSHAASKEQVWTFEILTAKPFLMKQAFQVGLRGCYVHYIPQYKGVGPQTTYWQVCEVESEVMGSLVAFKYAQPIAMQTCMSWWCRGGQTTQLISDKVLYW